MKTKKTSFGKWLSAIRKERGLTQSQLQKRTQGKLSKQYISILENDRPHGVTGAPPNPSKDVLEALAAALHVPFAEIARAAGWDVPVNANKPKLSPEDEAMELIYADFKLLSPEDKRAVLQLVELIGRDIRDRLHKGVGAGPLVIKDGREEQSEIEQIEKPKKKKGN